MLLCFSLAKRWCGLLVSAYGDASVDTALCYITQGSLYEKLGKHHRAAQALQKALHLLTTPGVVSGQDVNVHMLSLGLQLDSVGFDWTEIYETVERHYERNLGKNHLEYLNMRISWVSSLAQKQGHIEWATGEMEAILQASIQGYGENHSSTMAIRRRLIKMYCSIGKWEQATEHQLSSVAQLERTHGSSHVVTIAAKCWLAGLLGSQDQSEQYASNPSFEKLCKQYISRGRQRSS